MTQRRRIPSARKRNRRTLRPERLEPRQLLAGDLGLHNADNPSDVNGDGNISSSDALAVVNYIAREHAGEGEAIPTTNPQPKQVDVDDSGSVTAKDVLIVINDLGI